MTRSLKTLTQIALLALAPGALQAQARSTQDVHKAPLCVNPDAVISVDKLHRQKVSADKKDTTYVTIEGGQVQMTDLDGKRTNGLLDYERTIHINGQTNRIALFGSHGAEITPVDATAKQYVTANKNGSASINADSLYKNAKIKEVTLHLNAELGKIPGHFDFEHTRRVEIAAQDCRNIPANLTIIVDRANTPSHDAVQDARINTVEKRLETISKTLKQIDDSYTTEGHVDAQYRSLRSSLDSIRTEMTQTNRYDNARVIAMINGIEYRLDSLSNKTTANKPAVKPAAPSTFPVGDKPQDTKPQGTQPHDAPTVRTGATQLTLGAGYMGQSSVSDVPRNTFTTTMTGLSGYGNLVIAPSNGGIYVNAHGVTMNGNGTHHENAGKLEVTKLGTEYTDLEATLGGMTVGGVLGGIRATYTGIRTLENPDAKNKSINGAQSVTNSTKGIQALVGYDNKNILLTGAAGLRFVGDAQPGTQPQPYITGELNHEGKGPLDFRLKAEWMSKDDAHVLAGTATGVYHTKSGLGIGASGTYSTQQTLNESSRTGIGSVFLTYTFGK